MITIGTILGIFSVLALIGILFNSVILIALYILIWSTAIIGIIYLSCLILLFNVKHKHITNDEATFALFGACKSFSNILLLFLNLLTLLNFYFFFLFFGPSSYTALDIYFTICVYMYLNNTMRDFNMDTEKISILDDDSDNYLYDF